MDRNYTLLSGEVVLLKDLFKTERNAVSFIQRLIAQDPEGDGKGNYLELSKIVMRYPRDGLCYKVLYDIAKRAGIAQGVIPAPEHEEAVRKANFKFSTIPFASAAKHFNLKFSELRKLLENGDIEGKKVGNVWFVVLSSVQDYIKLRSGN